MPATTCDRYVPHAGEQLAETAIGESRGNDDAGGSNTSRLQVDERKDEGRESESAQAERRRVGELALRDRSEGTGLELTTEGSVITLSGVDTGKRTVAEASGGLCCVVLLLCHLARVNGGTAILAIAVVFLVIAIRGVWVVGSHV